MGRRFTCIFLLLITCVCVHAQPTWLWAKDAVSPSLEAGNDIAVDSLGNTYVCGNFRDNLSSYYGSAFASTFGGQDGFIAKYAQDGSLIWVFKIGGSGTDNASGIVLDANGNFYVTGSFENTGQFKGTSSSSNVSLTSAGNSDVFLAKYNSAGELQWVKQGSNNNNAYGYKIAINSSRIFVIGYFENSAAFSFSGVPSIGALGGDDAFFSIHDLSGNCIMLKKIGGTADEYGYDITADEFNCFIIGTFFSNSVNFYINNSTIDTTINNYSSGESDIFYASYEISSGNLQWASRIGSSGNFDDEGMGIAQNGSYIYLTGGTGPNSIFPGAGTISGTIGESIFLSQALKSNGQNIWAKIESDGGSSTAGKGYDVKSYLDRIWISGEFYSTTNFSGTSVTSGGADDIFIASYKTDGTLRYVKKGGATGSDKGYGLDVYRGACVYTCGLVGGAAVFDAIAFSASNGQNIGVAKIGCNNASGTISGSAVINQGQTANITLNFSGGAPYYYIFTDGTSYYSGTTNLSSITIPVSPSSTSTYTFYLLTSGTACDAIPSNLTGSAVVTVNLGISNNIINSGQIICTGQMPSALTGSFPSGGNGLYSYLWEQSLDSVIWTPALGINNLQNYSSGILNDSTYYRRLVYTVVDDTVISNTILISILPVTSNNLINSSQQICYGQVPAIINGSMPAGGNGSYSYTWLESNDNSLWISANGINNQQDYTPAILSDTVYYKRIVTSAMCSSDTSNSITINVLPDISNNLVSQDQSICSGQTPSTLMGTIPLGGNSAYVYLWEQSNDSINWISAAGINNLKDYSPPVLSAVTYYRRNVSSAMCEADTSSLITIDVLPPISNNIISSSQTICAGQTTDTLSGSVPLGGNSIYTYLWEESPDNINWIAATGTNTGSQYIPSLITNTTYYRRASFSSTCSNLSNSVVITLLPDISNNMISTTQIICEGQTPATINGTIPNGGDNSYTYSWEESADSINWTFAGGINNQQAYDPPALSYSMFYRRYVGSSACFTDTSNTIKITVIPSVSNNMITGSQVICSGQMPSVLTGSVPAGGTGTFVYYWEQSTDSISWSAASGINNLPDYSPFVLVSSFYYRRTVISSSCSIVSTPLKVTVLPPVSDNLISSDQTICAGSTPGGFTGSIPVGGDGMYNYFWEESNDNIAWTSASSVNNLQDYNSGPLSSTFYFRRIVSSNVCNDTSEALSVSVNPLPTVSISGSDSICEGDDLYISCNLTGSSPWTLICSDGINNITFNNIGSSVYTAIFQPTQSGNYTPVAIIDYNGCSGTVLNGSASVLVNVRPAVNAGADDSVCGLTINLNAIPSMGNGSWSSASSAVFDSAISASTSVTVQQGGEYTFTWTENNNGCQAQDDVKVNFYEPVNANAGEDMNIYFTHSGRMNATALEAGVGTWSLLSGSGTIQDLHQNNTVINDLAEGENVFKWTVVNGVCPVSEDEVTVIMHELYVPNGFSPNGDNVNDLYVIKNIEHSESSSLKIFNKWGMEVFDAENYANDWNGKGKTGLDLVEDTYYYTLRINDENYSGFIVLKRR